ncbi:MAG: hypothetical protein E5V77_09650, partial [Mesorhizobium sp.]
MDYSNIAPACQASEQKKSNGEVEIDRFLADFVAGLPIDFGSSEAPIVESIEPDTFATTPTVVSTPEPMEKGPSGAMVVRPPVTGTIRHTSSTLEGPISPRKASTSSTLKAPVGRRKATTRAKTTKPRWRHLGELDKLQASVEAAERVGGFAWSLNFGIGREGALLHADDPARLLSTYISRELRRAIGHDLPYSFAMELCPDGRLHTHGAIAAGAVDLDAVRKALIRAGGKIEGAARWVDDQLDLKPIKGAIGWTSYITKMRRWGKAVPKGQHVFISRQLKQMG